MTELDQDTDLICVIDDDAGVRGSLDSLLRAAGFAVRTFRRAPRIFLACAESDRATCLLLDIRLQGADGLDFQQALAESSIPVPVILITGHGDIPMTVRGMKAGAVNFLAKPIDEDSCCGRSTKPSHSTMSAAPPSARARPCACATRR